MVSTLGPDGATKTCSINGMAPRAVWPRPSASIGTGRQPRTASPSWAAVCSTTVRAFSASSGSVGKKARPTA